MFLFLYGAGYFSLNSSVGVAHTSILNFILPSVTIESRTFNAKGSSPGSQTEVSPYLKHSSCARVKILRKSAAVYLMTAPEIVLQRSSRKTPVNLPFSFKALRGSMFLSSSESPAISIAALFTITACWSMRFSTTGISGNSSLSFLLFGKLLSSQRFWSHPLPTRHDASGFCSAAFSSLSKISSKEEALRRSTLIRSIPVRYVWQWVSLNPGYTGAPLKSHIFLLLYFDSMVSLLPVSMKMPSFTAKASTIVKAESTVYTTPLCPIKSTDCFISQDCAAIIVAAAIRISFFICFI